MIDIEKLKPGQDVWVIHYSKPHKFISEAIKRYITASGEQINIVGGGFDVPADWCFNSEHESIDAQIAYWTDMKLQLIVGCDHKWIKHYADEVTTIICDNCGSKCGDHLYEMPLISDL